MINTTTELRINLSGKELDVSIRASIEYTSMLLLRAYNYENLDLAQVTTKRFFLACFPVFTRNFVLKTKIKLDENYLRCGFQAYQDGPKLMTRKQFEQITMCDLFPNQQFKRTYCPSIKSGLGLMLLVLHCRKVITLPSVFNWPISRTKDSRVQTIEPDICADSELLSFLRTMGPSGNPLEPAFKALGADIKKIGWFSTYGPKLLLATGWNSPQDVNLDDLLKIKAVNIETNGVVSVYHMLLDCLARKYPSIVNISMSQWRSLSIGVSTNQKKSARRSLENSAKTGSSTDMFYQVAKLPASIASPDRLFQMLALPGINFDVSGASSVWLQLYDAYLKVRRESYNAPLRSIGFLNLYLFYYLPYWFNENPNATFVFPSTPNLLFKSIFISRLLPLDQCVPYTFIEYMNARQSASKNADSTLYSDIKQVEVFFEFIENRGNHTPGCDKFKQPLSKSDYPPSPRSFGTDKSPLPRRLFSPFMNFVECVLDYMNMINIHMLDESITGKELANKILKFTSFIDTKSLFIEYGFPVPSFLVNDVPVEVQFLPLTVTAQEYSLKDGRRITLLRNHALIQILVALYTGARHNHLQWLDRDKFDQFVDNAGLDFAKLFINTDKAKKKPWIVTVNSRVLELLRSQRNWRDLVDELGFEDSHFYNNNSKTVYPKFKPLFSFSPDGLPHSDAVYNTAWARLLSGFQSLIPSLPVEGVSNKVICKHRPAHVMFNDMDEKAKLRAHADKTYENFCPLSVKTDMSPHSTRVTVVSHLAPYLPPELIGKYVTNQEPATVYHYIKIDPEDLNSLQVQQARDMQDRAYRSQVEGFLEGDAEADAPFIKADDVNSNLAKSMRIDIKESIIRFGCISIDYRDGKPDGVDILKESGIHQSAFNKTEICPYGNNCPQDVILALKGLRRCALCPYAVRSIDHLPALIAREKQAADQLSQIEAKVNDDSGSYTSDELDELELQRQRLGEEYAGWRMCIEILELQRIRVASGEDSRSWIVEKPEIIEQDLKRICVPTGVTAYLLSRLQESVQYPGFQSPTIMAEFDMLRRKVLASKDIGKMSDAFSSRMPINPAAECAGLIRSLASAHDLSLLDFEKIMLTDQHISTMPMVYGSLSVLN